MSALADSPATMWMEVALASCLLSASVWLRYQWANRRLLRLARQRPTSLPALPVIGHVHHFLFNTEVFTSSFLRFFTQPGQPVTCFWLGSLPYFVIHRVEDFQTFLTTAKTTHKTGDYDLFKFVFGEGLVTAPVHTWKKTRRHLNPIFRTTNMAYLIASFNESARTLLTELDRNMGQGQNNVHRLIASLAAKNAIKLLLGFDYGIERFTENSHILLDLINTLSVLIAQRLLYPWLWIDDVFKYLYKSIISKVDYAYELIGKDEINKVIHDFQNTQFNASKPDKDDETPHNGRLSTYPRSVTSQTTLPEAFSKLRLEDPRFGEHSYMRDEATTLISVGTETVSATMCSCLIALGTNPEVQETLYEEITSISENKSDDITIEDINNMPYLDQVIKETMRRFCIVPVVSRKADKDIIMGDASVIPAGASVIMALPSLHMDPVNYPDPLGFNPGNFSPENVAGRGKYSFLPFFSGARDCIARDYAKIQMKITIAHLIRKYQIHSDMDINKMQLKYGVTLTSLNGYCIELNQRQ